MRLTKTEEGAFVFQCLFEENHHAKLNGFQFIERRWWSADPFKARPLMRYADPETRDFLLTRLEQADEMVRLSWATTSQLDVPAPPGQEYYAFQRAGVEYVQAVFRNRWPGIYGVLLGDPMGIGKTIQAIGAINLLGFRKILVLCPASLKPNWRRELEKWLVEERLIVMADAHTPKWKLDAAQVVITNYDVLRSIVNLKKSEEGRAKRTRWSIAGYGALEQPWDFVISDECQYLRNRTRAQRAVCGLGLLEQGSFSAGLSGTPLVKQPLELYGIGHALAPGIFSGVSYFQRRYCEGHMGDFGYDASGASHLDELRQVLRSTVMVRRRKEDVLPDLPPKQRQVIEIEPSSAEARRAISAENEAWFAHEERLLGLKVDVEITKAADDPNAHKRAVEKLNRQANIAFTGMSAARKALGLAKVPFVIEHLQACFEDNPTYKVVAGGHHTEVLEAIAAAFPGRALLMTGSVDSKPRIINGRESSDRQELVDRFQEQEAYQLIIGEFGPLGTGWTLTASSHVLIVEETWNPGDLTQFEDRCHRIGQKDSVLVQHLVLVGSLDARQIYSMVEKQRIAEQALDSSELAEPVVPLQEAATRKLSREALDALADSLTRAQRHAALKAVRFIRGRAEAGAQEFGAVDARIAWALALNDELTVRQAGLAHQVASAYIGHLPAEIAATLKGGK